MSGIEILNENTLNLAELKDRLESVKKRDGELNARSTKMYNYIGKFLKKTDDSKKIAEVKKKLSDVDIGRLKERHINKIIDIRPKNADELKAILSGENLTLKQDDLNKVLEAIKNA
jgi:DNA-directed RNA polymerase subunit F